jgi:hypothetical protein
LDVRYVRELSLLLDARTLVLTMWEVLNHKGVQVDPRGSMPDFDAYRQLRTASVPAEARRE